MTNTNRNFYERVKEAIRILTGYKEEPINETKTNNVLEPPKEKLQSFWDDITKTKYGHRLAMEYKKAIEEYFIVLKEDQKNNSEILAKMSEEPAPLPMYNTENDYGWTPSYKTWRAEELKWDFADKNIYINENINKLKYFFGPRIPIPEKYLNSVKGYLICPIVKIYGNVYQTIEVPPTFKSLTDLFDHIEEVSKYNDIYLYDAQKQTTVNSASFFNLKLDTDYDPQDADMFSFNPEKLRKDLERVRKSIDKKLELLNDVKETTKYMLRYVLIPKNNEK